jgi:hypothetical protein
MSVRAETLTSITTPNSRSGMSNHPVRVRLHNCAVAGFIQPASSLPASTLHTLDTARHASTSTRRRPLEEPSNLLQSDIEGEYLTGSVNEFHSILTAVQPRGRLRVPAWGCSGGIRAVLLWASRSGISNQARSQPRGGHRCQTRRDMSQPLSVSLHV